MKSNPLHNVVRLRRENQLGPQNIPSEDDVEWWSSGVLVLRGRVIGVVISSKDCTYKEESSDGTERLEIFVNVTQKVGTTRVSLFREEGVNIIKRPITIFVETDLLYIISGPHK